MAPGEQVERAGEFADALGRLKRRGSALLVVGATPESTHQRACRRMLGSSEQPRVVCRTDRSCTAGERLAGRGDHVVDLSVAARSATTDAGASQPNGGTGPTAPDQGPARTTTDTIPAFGAAATESIETVLESDAEDVRVCVDSLLPLVDAVGAERAFQLCHSLAADVRAAGGVCHAHLPVDRDDSLAETFEVLADATVELRLVDDHAEQRWHIHGSVTSDWLPLDDR